MGSVTLDIDSYLHFILKQDATKPVPTVDPPLTYVEYAKVHLGKIVQIIALIPAPTQPRPILTSFIDNTCSDIDLPYDAESITTIISTPYRQAKYLAAQSRFLAEDIREGEHRNYGPEDFVPYVLAKDSVSRGGASGTVTKVEFVKDGSAVFARKELHLGIREESDGEWGGYQMELRNLAGLNHPHLVKLRCSYTQNHKAYIIMSPYAPLSLLDFLKKPDGCPFYNTATIVQRKEMLLGWMSCLASGMVYLHDSFMKHMDVKPDNILLHVTSSSYPSPLLTGFGISKKFTLSQGSHSLAQSGTEFWQAPEHMRKRKAGRAADVFALGGIFMLLLAVSHGNSTQSIINALQPNVEYHIPGFAANLERVVLPYIAQVSSSAASKAAWDLVREMLSPDVEVRPTARDVWKTMKGILEEGGFDNHCATLPPTPQSSLETLKGDNGDGDIGDTASILARLRLEREKNSSSLW